MALEEISERLQVSDFPTLGMAANYDLRRHKFESLANDGSHEMRADVRRWVGNPSDFGGCNPINGHIIALTMPMIKPDRVKIAGYIYECWFLYSWDLTTTLTGADGFFHDDILEGTNEGVSDTDAFGLGTADQDAKARDGRKQIQAKMMYLLETTDKACAKHLQKVWSNMLVTTIQHKSRDFETLKEYIDFRIRDCGALFGEGVMLFGMGLALTEKDREDVASTIYPCYAALGLTNDYFSFDREWEEAKRTGEAKFSNAVRLFMDWQSTGAAAAKEVVRKAIIEYEREFLELREKFVKANPKAERLHKFLEAMVYQISGHVVWSINCPRYNPSFRYDPNSGVENQVLAERRGKSSSKKPSVMIEEIDEKSHLASETGPAMIA
ncbi:Atr13 [Stachybotrys chlorohalonatus IBT 40285]|uniref:Terpene cyclase ATR13 n=1 Tax=Stachybotrys chlorohalonatus (strain IBT 40285) TaxID=1283841 RepID=ATR13_STAC4|nr:RecName: Full=Terpene cyclase ATR13; AltName: Full=Core atranone cluster (CAC) protein 13 [Stachybotrys chlorohalonata IBT 40285]KFA70092.1 Atr13 [Stachybotrys chlorohalonata IBT 40285]